ncbi:CDP-diacylglycerol--serine O-phosphatidyltransferase [Candidatus Bealeia paramacronuclearis]|uniref:CDP-diacylglycerol--serine O-phosphatidyltransferase n=1 Tax=Candidatus Bealeia paramacronuclearis TaxID=1921001 RepID=A0ABZ2C2Q7_9PROT|nr:CDP-diacylglycerol--serine O-phosphatidyltransferase [Candidatus Bealeia paramacronuclearis]
MARKRIPPSPLIKVIPNVITVTALCAGLSAIRFAYQGDWEKAVALIIIAGILDGMDGRIARLLQADSDFGVQLDSLADFVSFGVAPSILIYLYSLQLWGNFGWAMCLFFVTCQALRLARFNTHAGSAAQKKPEWMVNYSVGVPAPAGAILAMTPLMLLFGLHHQGWTQFSLNPFVMSLFMLMSAALMASRIPTFVPKNIRAHPKSARFILIVVAVLMASLISVPWLTLGAGGFLYLASIPFSYISYKKALKRNELASSLPASPAIEHAPIKRRVLRSK